VPDLGVTEFVDVGSMAWWIHLAFLLFGRAADLFSTWLATPNLALEANPLARRLGWRFGLPLNLALALVTASWPLLAISLTTTSLLVAARNFQHAWLMRTLGESGYRLWFSECIARSRRGLVVVSHLGEALLTAVVGAALLFFSGFRLVPFGIGLGIVAYATAVAVFTTISLWRCRE
jgi:hypothetical protein